MDMSLGVIKSAFRSKYIYFLIEKLNGATFAGLVCVDDGDIKWEREWV